MHKLYIIVRDDLDFYYKMVQGGHAIAQWLLDHPDQTWNNNYLIFVSVKDLFYLKELKNKLSLLDINFSEFHEPDLNEELTSIACLDNGKLFKKLKLTS